jgi:hypothetical protein
MDWMVLLQQFGLPVVAVFALAYAFWKLLNRTLQNHDTDRQVWKEAMDKHTDMANANFTKLIDATAALTVCVSQHEASDVAEHRRILDCISRIEQRRTSNG